MKVTTQSYGGVDLSKYHAFAWGTPPMVQGEKGVTLKPETDSVIRQSLADGLAAHGVTEASKAPANTPTLAVGYSVLVKKETVTRPHVSTTDRNTGKELKDEYVFDVGTLLVEFTDKATGQKVWWGAAEADLKPSSNGAQAREAVGQLLAKYPK